MGPRTGRQAASGTRLDCHGPSSSLLVQAIQIARNWSHFQDLGPDLSYDLRMAASRLLIDPPLPGPINMARDEALLMACTDPDAPPVLRFYAWSPPTISLGYFQDYAEYERLPPPAGDLPVVRRTTGGGAILHDLELTYSIVIPASHALVAGRPNHLYELAHQAVIDAIGHGVRLLGTDNTACGASTQRGPFFCFARRHGLDVVIDEPRTSTEEPQALPEEPRASARAAPATHEKPAGCSKLAGSAQRRTKTAVLQHGSVVLDSRYTQQPAATWRRLAGEPISFDRAVRRLRSAFEASLGMALRTDSWSEEELKAAMRYEQRYAGKAWTVHRRRDG
ncbi:MAG: lipoate--protein ligase family protein [Phycisphaerae bacterium]|nr:lipoate--protein ligase family protein [Phycisphaerae bacterium]